MGAIALASELRRVPAPVRGVFVYRLPHVVRADASFRNATDAGALGMNGDRASLLRRRIRTLTGFFIIGLAASGATAIPLAAEVDALARGTEIGRAHV